MKQSADASKTVLHRGAALWGGLRPRQNIMGQALSVVSDTGKPSDTISRERVTFLATVLVCVTPAANHCDTVPETTPLQ